MGEALLPGVEIKLGGVAYTMPPCGFDTLEKYAEQIDRQIFSPDAQTALSLEKIRLTVDVVHGALQLNYPELKREVVARGLNADNAAHYLTLAITQSLPPPPMALQGRAGEGANTLGESTGAASKPA